MAEVKSPLTAARSQRRGCQGFLADLSTGLEADYGYLLPTTAAITDASTDEEIIAAFETLGTLQVRALRQGGRGQGDFSDGRSR